MPQRRFMLVIPLLVALVSAGCSRPPLQRFEFTRIAMGVEARIVLYAPDRELAAESARAAFARIAELEDSFSDYRPNSELMRLCRGGGAGPAEVSEDLWRVLSVAREVGEASDGAFDVSVGPIVRLWREARREGRLPDADSLRLARARCGWEHLALDDANRTATLARADMLLDLGGIGKGDAAQQAVETLDGLGLPRCLVALAGDVAVGEPPPNAKGWIVETANGPVALRRQAVSTSGETEQFIEVDGVRYSHIVDPATGLGVTNHVEVTVIAPRGEFADALASAASVGGLEGAKRLSREYPEAMFIVTDGASGVSITLDPRGDRGRTTTAPE